MELRDTRRYCNGRTGVIMLAFTDKPQSCLKIVPETLNPNPIKPKPLHMEPPTRTPYPLATLAYPAASLELWVLVFELRVG